MKIKDYFESEIKDGKLSSKQLSKYITCFDYTDTILTVFLTIYSGVNIFSHVKEKEYTGLISSAFSLTSCLSIGILKKLLYETKKRKKKHNKLFYLCKDKVDCIEMFISQSITDLDISHEEFKTIMNEKKKDYDNQKQYMTDKKLSKTLQV